MKIILLNFLFGILIIVSSCANKENDKTRNKTGLKKYELVNKTVLTDIVRISLSESKQYYTGNEITVSVKYLSDTIKYDSIVVFVNTKKSDIKISGNSFVLNTSGFHVGKSIVKVAVYKDNNIIDDSSIEINLLSDIKAVNYKAKIINKYHHDPNAYTQGLFVDKGILYEGTGQYGASSLRKIDLKTGNLIESLGISRRYFGEGITSFNNKIIQLTWRSQIGFIYSKDNFELIKKVQYPTEGWGITFDGNKLIMSDGSSVLHFLDPEYFYKTGDITVCDNSSEIKMLNELEYIKGQLYANIWQTDFIFIINPDNGKVIGKIDCSNLVPEKYKNEVDLVLNGIAYDKNTDKMFVTGKMWDVLYEIEIEEK